MRTTLLINDTTVELNPFIEGFLGKTVAGAVSALRGAENMQSLEVSLKGREVRVTVNGTQLPLTGFPEEIIASTLLGMVSPLKGVDEVDSLDIKVDY